MVVEPLVKPDKDLVDDQRESEKNERGFYQRLHTFFRTHSKTSADTNAVTQVLTTITAANTTACRRNSGKSVITPTPAGTKNSERLRRRMWDVC
jgi:hypothetical protein